MVDTEKLTDFPRHGQRRKNNTDNTRIRKKRVMTDDLFKSGKEELSNKPKKSKERKKKTEVDEEDEVAVIEELNVRSLPIGCTVFGCIQEIREFEMKMSLPGDIQCVIPITNISELYTESLENFANDEISTPPLKLKSMFRIGECFPVKVLEKKEDNHTFQGVAVNRIHVVGSLDPKDIYEDVVSSTFAKCCNHVTMSAVVESVEDHGYIMDIGLKGLKAFMSKDDSEPFLEKLNVNSLTVGQLMLCEVKSCDNRIIKLGAVTKNTITGSESVHFSASCLLPGLRISATVMDVSEKGLHVMVLNEFKGFVHKNHLKSVWDLPTRDYKIAQNVKGTILYRNPLTKLVAITLRKMDPESLTQNWHGIRVGKIIKKATVVGKEETGTVVFKFKPGLKAVIPKNQLADEFLTTAEFTDLDNKLEIGTKHMFRIKSICYIDGYAMGSLKPSILSKDDISVEDIEIGNFVIGKVKRLTDQGLVVQLGYNIQGFVPTIHLAESANVQNPEKLYPLDKEVKCRVIRIDKNVEPPKIVLTCKKSLLKKNLLIIDYFNKAEIGMETDGVIALINEHGILIELFNGVRGFAPLNLLSEAKITNAHSMFKVGQVVHCTVISTIPTQRKMILSLIGIRTREDQSSQGKRKRSTTDTEELGSPKKTKDTDEEDCVKKMKSVEKDGSSKPTVDDIEVGNFVVGKVKRLTDQGLVVQLGYNQAFVPSIHLAESSNVQNLEKLYPLDKEVKCRVIRVEKNVKHPKIVLTCKKSLLKKNLLIIDYFNKAETGMETDGVIALINEHGLLIELFNGVRGFAPLNLLSEAKITDANTMFKVVNEK
ncbi:protein RRP5-like protein [Leptotrombidium deliense]|uniref:rRNA biogenesis protein RRP5 n=1 Tax=Leptotrombidium deliense TaxID=299467 RepID=A0A443SJ22_9ACAR|nr:protein RRP5-like protein [Leptotrombidium deliense]